MQVIGVVMHGADALVLGVAEPGAEPRFDRGKNLGRRVLAGRETDQQVIGLVALRARIEVLGGQHFIDRRLHRAGFAVGHCDESESLGLVLRVGDIADQAGEIAVPDRAHGDVLGDHDTTPRILAAKEITTRPSVEPRTS